MSVWCENERVSPTRAAVRPRSSRALGAQVCDDSPHLLDALPRRFARLYEVLVCAPIGGLRRLVDQQQRPRQQLTQFVVQLAGDTDAFLLLRRERALRALAPLRLEPV